MLLASIALLCAAFANIVVSGSMMKMRVDPSDGKIHIGQPFPQNPGFLNFVPSNQGTNGQPFPQNPGSSNFVPPNHGTNGQPFPQNPGFPNFVPRNYGPNGEDR
ncbi:hypothetical protein Y032_0652g1158 [Ancylostoma ceylanicum]|uniref:Uncharacterized protein n=4 Tax=Ancylostoma ceylanicum TaxID=53326 RepID=A0A016WIW9_9BILA|nr:hypothetical protein Y032_0652g1158 [Ancylostoma ceylanicum]